MTHRRVRGIAAFSLCALVGWFLAGASSAGAARQSSEGSGPHKLQTAGSRPALRGKLSVAQQRALSRGYLVPDETKYANAKARAAAIAMTRAGFGPCFNVADGFEGNLDQTRHRGTSGGWKASGLPWVQT